jgi:hypothetical protein
VVLSKGPFPCSDIHFSEKMKQSLLLLRSHFGDALLQKSPVVAILVCDGDDVPKPTH